jgi:hypothetical protein
MTQRQQPSNTSSVWASPVSLTTTPGILSFPQGTEMFQFPRFPPPCLCVQHGVIRYYPDGVAPFGYPRIIAYPRLPEAFRGLVTSFFGSRCQGIHRVPFTRIRPTVLTLQNQHSTIELTLNTVMSTPTHVPSGVSELPHQSPHVAAHIHVSMHTRLRPVTTCHSTSPQTTM